MTGHWEMTSQTEAPAKPLSPAAKAKAEREADTRALQRSHRLRDLQAALAKTLRMEQASRAAGWAVWADADAMKAEEIRAEIEKLKEDKKS